MLRSLPLQRPSIILFLTFFTLLLGSCQKQNAIDPNLFIVDNEVGNLIQIDDNKWAIEVEVPLQKVVYEVINQEFVTESVTEAQANMQVVFSGEIEDGRTAASKKASGIGRIELSALEVK